MSSLRGEDDRVKAGVSGGDRAARNVDQDAGTVTRIQRAAIVSVIVDWSGKEWPSDVYEFYVDGWGVEEEEEEEEEKKEEEEEEEEKGEV